MKYTFVIAMLLVMTGCAHMDGLVVAGVMANGQSTLHVLDVGHEINPAIQGEDSAVLWFALRTMGTVWVMDWAERQGKGAQWFVWAASLAFSVPLTIHDRGL